MEGTRAGPALVSGRDALGGDRAGVRPDDADPARDDVVGRGQRGEWRRPSVVRAVRPHADWTFRSLEETERVASEVKPETLAFIREGLRGVVHEPGGTGHAARVEGLDIGGKTGTAQVVSLRERREAREARFRDHAWFVAVAPVANPGSRSPSSSSTGARRERRRAGGAEGDRSLSCPQERSARARRSLVTVDRRFIEHFDWVLLLIVLLISAAGVLTIYSASATPYGPQPTLYLRQIYWIGVGLVVMLAAAAIDLNTLRRLGPVFYVAAVILLLSVLVMGRVGMGARRWVQAGPVSFQPSEFAKVFLIFWLASHLADRPPSSGLRLRDLARPAALLALPFLLVLKQPDLGTAAILFFVAATMFVAAGVRLKPLLALAAAAGGVLFHVARPVGLPQGVSAAEDPRVPGSGVRSSRHGIPHLPVEDRHRLRRFLGQGIPGGDAGAPGVPPGTAHRLHLRRLRGGVGFLGAIALVGLFVFFVVWSAEIAYRARHRFDMLLAAGVTALFAWYTLVNLGMTMGLTPVVGVPLPFMSYGGSSVVAGFAAVGILMNVRYRRFRIFG